MMKQLLTVVLFISTSTILKAQVKVSAEQLKVNQAVTKLFDGIATLDMNLIRHSSSKDFLLLEDGAIWNTDTLINKLTPLKAMNVSRINHLDFIRTEVKGNTAWVAYHNAADMTINGQKRNVRWLESAVLVKEDTEWKIRLLHSTVVRQQKTN